MTPREFEAFSSSCILAANLWAPIYPAVDYCGRTTPPSFCLPSPLAAPHHRPPARLHTATMSAEEMKAPALALAGESDDQRCGGVRDAPGCENDLGAIDLARFAIDAHKKNALTTLAPVLLSVTCKLQRLYSCSLVVP
jgi:hypothetical protein